MATPKRPTPDQVVREAAAIYPDTNPGAPTAEEIAAEAYRIYLDRGGQHGQDMNDWLEAERRLSASKRAIESAGGSGTWRERDADRRAHGDDDLKA
ncbi:MAG: DUF2934 domain-containing protein [Acidobacteria bacterium]|nr:DUF2934 domain-containing protein [Acidobacteriota bacterium]